MKFLMNGEVVCDRHVASTVTGVQADEVVMTLQDFQDLRKHEHQFGGPKFDHDMLNSIMTRLVYKQPEPKHAKG